MRVLFTTQPATGHLRPLLPLAGALSESGHEVAFACAEPFRPEVEASGFPSFPAGLDWLVADAERYFPQVREARVAEVGGGPAFSLIRDVFAGAAAELMVPDVLALARSWRPDAIVRDPLEFGACVAAERLGLPHMVGWEDRFLAPPAWRQLVGEPLGALRAAHGLPPEPELAMLYRYAGFAWVPPRYVGAIETELVAKGALGTPVAPFGSHIAPTMHFLRPAAFDQPGDEALPEWVARLPDQPTVYAAFGVVWNQRPQLCRAIVEGLRDEPLNLIVAVGRNQNPAEFGPQPPNVRFERHVPQTLLAAHGDLVIAAGDFETVMGALAAGRPLVVIPLGADQAVNARRCAALGVAEAIEPDECTPEAIRAAALQVLQAPRYRLAARRLREEMEALPGPDYAVQIIEQLVAEQAQ